jgi:hypothetical protein
MPAATSAAEWLLGMAGAGTRLSITTIFDKKPTSKISKTCVETYFM